MGTKTKTNSNKVNVSSKLIKQLVERIDSLEQAMFHAMLRSESMINVLLKSNVVDKEAFNSEISRLFEESQAEIASRNNMVVPDQPDAELPKVTEEQA